MTVNTGDLERFELVVQDQLSGIDAASPQDALKRCYSLDPQGRIWVQICESEDALTLYEAHARVGYPTQFIIYGGNGCIEVAPYFPGL